MAGPVTVFLVTGFLGSGKTTFLNHLIKHFPRNRKLMILMNEFGEVGIDGVLVEGEELDILEISKGSIFCACVKTDFIKGLYEIAHKFRPDILVIESTGVANPSDLKRDLELPIFNNCFHLKEQFCLIDAAHFLDEFEVFASVERQIKSCNRFIINKIDIADREKIEAIKKLITRYNPQPSFYETTYGKVDITGLLDLEPPENVEELNAGFVMGEGELDQYIEGLLDDPGASLAPPDILMSAVFKWVGNNGVTIEVIESLTKALPREVIRVKGFLTVSERIYLYNYVLGQHSFCEYSMPIKDQQRNILVMILRPQAMAIVDDIMSIHNFTKVSELMPMRSLC